MRATRAVGFRTLSRLRVAEVRALVASGVGVSRRHRGPSESGDRRIDPQGRSGFGSRSGRRYEGPSRSGNRAGLASLSAAGTASRFEYGRANVTSAVHDRTVGPTRGDLSGAETIRFGNHVKPSTAIAATRLTRGMRDWKPLPGRVVYTLGNFRVVEDRWRLPDGRRVVHPLVKSPSFAVVVGVTEEHEIPFVKNLHPSPGLRLLELPGGRMEPNESPRAAARRELMEETGWIARKLTLLGRYHPNPHWGTFEGHIFLAEALLRGKPRPDPGELLRPVRLPISEVYWRLHQHRFRGGSTIVALSMAEDRLRAMGLLSDVPRGR
jgi:ADP-ribose pyrophosphatase